ncbi:hypothetical protein OPKNFCMD_3868 [Methylobacterium crusticola]|uniref:Uncharacterized protein n=1 Tax=Methylobacterium crusticola TaxID=1697972 RepID=A0ABQ4R0B5_9HYPH|nr:hypothetical protein [Methylobacterium crusticola]GJD51117.1 hypothetical protein OPKNFCMD_3868 [Methylobacterium crusticola]
MAAPSKVLAAKTAPDRQDRITRMAAVMQHHQSGDGACTFAHLAAAGFSEAEIEAYRDAAREQLSGRPIAITLPAGRVEGLALVRHARAVRARRNAAHPA